MTRTPAVRAVASASRDAVAQRVGEPDQGAHLPRLVVAAVVPGPRAVRPRVPRSRSARARPAVPSPGGRRQRQDGLGRPDREFLACPSGVRACVRDSRIPSPTGSDAMRSSGSSRPSPPAASTARASEAVNDPGCRSRRAGPTRRPPRGAPRPAGSPDPRVVTGPASPRTEATSSWLRVSVPVLSVMIRSIEPSVSWAFRRRTSTSRLSSRYAPSPRMTASRIGGSSGMAAIAAEIPASTFAPASWPRRNPSPVTITISPVASDEQDPHEPIEFRLERRAAALDRTETACDPADFRARADRDDHPFTAAADDARPAIRHRMPARPAARPPDPGRRSRALAPIRRSGCCDRRAAGRPRGSGGRPARYRRP